MSQDNVDAVRRLFKSVEARDLAGVLAAYDPEIVIREAGSLPYGGEYHGLEGAQQHSIAYEQTWSNFQSSADKALDPVFLDAGEHTVVMWRQRGSAGDGRRLDLPAVSVYKVRDGKVVESQMYQDTSAILDFLGSTK
jgi:ketosteroid isomerase-like protein